MAVPGNSRCCTRPLYSVRSTLLLGNSTDTTPLASYQPAVVEQVAPPRAGRILSSGQPRRALTRGPR